VALTVAVLALVTVVNVAPAAASTQIETVTVPPTDTDYTQTVDIPQFDQANGILRSVDIELTAAVEGIMQIENLSESSDSTGTVTLAATITVSSVDDPSVTVTPAFPADDEAFALEIFDGTIDFAGPSGMSFPDLNGSDSVTATFTDPADLAVFIGTGTSPFSVDALATSAAAATGGNIELVFTTLASAEINVTYQFDAPSINIEKTPDQQTVGFGSDVTFTIDVTNDGEADLVNVTVTDPVTPDCDNVIGDLAIGETFTYTCVFPAATADFTNVATVTGEDSLGNVVTDEDDAVVDVIAPEITIEKLPDSQTIGFMGNATFTLVVTNTGDLDLINVSVTDPLAPDCDLEIGSLAVGASLTYDCTLETVLEDFTNVATVTGEDEEGNVVTDEDDAPVDVLAPSIDIEKTPDDQTVIVGRDAVFTITVTNNGDVDLFEVTVTDPVTPSCETFIGDMAIGDVSTYNCTAPAVIDPFTNVATATGVDAEGNEVSDVDDAIVRVAQPPPSEPELPATGSDAIELSIVGWLLVLMGAALVRYERHRSAELK
jgi:uncharacterized repeat protein (TIGR01451 family)